MPQLLVSTPSLPDGGLGVRIALRRDAARSPTTWTWTRRVPRGYSASTWRKRGKSLPLQVESTSHVPLQAHTESAPAASMPRLGVAAPLFEAVTTHGRIRLEDCHGGWAVLFRTRRFLRRSAPRSFWPLRPLLPNCAHGTPVVPCAWRFARDGRSWVSGVKMRGSFNHSAWTFTAVYAGSGRGQQKNDIASTGFRFVRDHPAM